jgi:GNAT superfamily N-acetyltransferase
MIDPGTLSLAENANTHSPLGPQHERIENERFVLWMGPGDHPSHNVAQRLRLVAETVDETVEEVHSILRERGRHACTWELGSSATPSDLRERLYARGMVDDSDPEVVAMVLAVPPPPPLPGVEARPVRDVEELIEARRVAHAAFGMPALDPAEMARWRGGWDEEQAGGRTRTFVALLDGRIVAHGTSTYTEHGVTLNGGATAPDARGHGAYRALVSARWDDAVERGIPVLVTQAGAMSRPILGRVGFVEVARIWVLLDNFTSEAPA